MLLIYITLLYISSLGSIHTDDSSASHISKLETLQFTTSSTPILNQTTTSRILLAVSNGAHMHPQSNQPFLNTDVKQEGVNSYSQLSKFLVNSSSSQEVPTKTEAASNSLPIMIILVSLCTVAFIIAGILTALFVMKRRFSILRISGSKGNDCSNNDGAANGMLTHGSESSSVTGSAHGKCEEVCEKEKEVLASALQEAATDVDVCDGGYLISVENKQAVFPLEETVEPCLEAVKEVVEANEVVIENNEAIEIVENQTEVVESKVEAVEEVVTSEVIVQQQNDDNKMNLDKVDAVVTTSSTSLIANVLNELSESVVLKLQSSDPEKQPFNLE